MRTLNGKTMNTPRSHNTVQELNNSIFRDLNRVKSYFNDSPRSALDSLISLRGFYNGYCDAMQWDTNDNVCDLIDELTEHFRKMLK